MCSPATRAGGALPGVAAGGAPAAGKTGWTITGATGTAGGAGASGGGGAVTTGGGGGIAAGAVGVGGAARGAGWVGDHCRGLSLSAKVAPRPASSASTARTATKKAPARRGTELLSVARQCMGSIAGQSGRGEPSDCPRGSKPQ